MALERIVQAPVRLTVAGRTDAGVHARGQVASFEHAAKLLERFAERVNAVAPRDLAVVSAQRAADGFDARRDARSRTYRYRVLTSRLRDPFEEGRALWWPHRMEVEALHRCAEVLRGRRDFTAFTPAETEHVRFERRILGAEWKQAGPRGLDLVVEADAFMRHMVRVLVGTMLEVAGGKRTVEEFERLLAGAPRPAAGPTAPPHGLYLESVSY